MTLYHGSYLEISEPDLANSRSNVDFGRGFYVTPLYEQASKWCKSSVTISHRLSNTTLADKILVISDGRIIEQGSHSELLGQGGVYAHLFQMQASRYK